MNRRFLWPLVILCCVMGVSLILAGERRLPSQSVDAASDSTMDSPPYIFRLELDGGTVAEYTECWGLGSSNDIVESTIVNTSGVTVIQKTPGALRWHDIKLSRTGPSDSSIWSWRKAMEDGDANQAFRDGEIVMLTKDPPNQWVAQWSFHRGWAASLDLNGPVEELIIVHEGLARESSTSGHAVRPDHP